MTGRRNTEPPSTAPSNVSPNSIVPSGRRVSGVGNEHNPRRAGSLRLIGKLVHEEIFRLLIFRHAFERSDRAVWAKEERDLIVGLVDGKYAFGVVHVRGCPFKWVNAS